MITVEIAFAVLTSVHLNEERQVVVGAFQYVADEDVVAQQAHVDCWSIDYDYTSSHLAQLYGEGATALDCQFVKGCLRVGLANVSNIVVLDQHQLQRRKNWAVVIGWRLSFGQRW